MAVLDYYLVNKNAIPKKQKCQEMQIKANEAMVSLGSKD